MNVKDIRELLEDYDDDVEVLIAHQPSWPLQEVVERVVSSVELGIDEDFDEDEEPGDEIVYLVAGGHPHRLTPYAPRACWEG